MKIMKYIVPALLGGMLTLQSYYKKVKCGKI